MNLLGGDSVYEFHVFDWIIIILSGFGWFALQKKFKNEIKEEYEEELDYLRHENKILCENNQKLIQELLELTREKEQK